MVKNIGVGSVRERVFFASRKRGINTLFVGAFIIISFFVLYFIITDESSMYYYSEASEAPSKRIPLLFYFQKKIIGREDTSS